MANLQGGSHVSGFQYHDASQWVPAKSAIPAQPTTDVGEGPAERDPGCAAALTPNSRLVRSRLWNRPHSAGAPDDEFRLQNDSLRRGVGILDSLDQRCRRPSTHLSARHFRDGHRWIREACLGNILVADERKVSSRVEALPRQAMAEPERYQIVAAIGSRRTRSESGYPAGGSIPFSEIGSRRPDERAVERNRRLPERRPMATQTFSNTAYAGISADKSNPAMPQTQ